MAIQTLSFISLILRPYVQQDIDPDGWAYLLDHADPNRNFDGEIMAFGAMSGGDIDRIINHLFAYGYNRPDTGEIRYETFSLCIAHSSPPIQGRIIDCLQESPA